MEHQFYELKVKRGTLAAEARILKRLSHARLTEARRVKAKFGDPTGNARMHYESLSGHYHSVVKPEGRASHLAAMFLKGTPRQEVEHPLLTRKMPDRTRVEAIVRNFTGGDSQELMKAFSAWWDEYSTPEGRAAFQQRLDEKRHVYRSGKPERDAHRRAERLKAAQ